MKAHSIVYIFGPQKLYNETMQYVVTHEMGLYCELILSSDHLTSDTQISSQHQDNQYRLGLFDYQDEHIRQALLTGNSRDHFSSRMASLDLVLYNVQRENGIEKSAISLGFKGVFYEDDHKELIKKGITAICNGELWFPRKILSEVLSVVDSGKKALGPPRDVNISAREKEILSMITQGKSNADISSELCISISTVKTHLYNIFQKINAPNRLQAALWAMENSHILS